MKWKSARRRRKYCSLAAVRSSQKFRPAADPFPGVRDGQNLSSLRWSLPSPADPVWLGSMHEISSYRGNKLTHKQTNNKQTYTATHPQTGPITIHCAAAVQCNKKRSDETQTLRAGCSKAEPKKFAPPQTPFPRAQGGQNLISWRWSLPLPTNPVWWGSMNAISSYRGNRPTHKHTHTHRKDRLQYTAPQTGSVTTCIVYAV